MQAKIFSCLGLAVLVAAWAPRTMAAGSAVGNGPSRAQSPVGDTAPDARRMAQANRRRGKRKAPAPAPVEAEVPAPAEPEPAEPVEAAEPAPSAPAPEPVPVPEAATAAPAAPSAARPDVSELRSRYDQLRDAVFRARARRETLEKALFSTKLTTIIRWDSNRHYRLERAEVRLDGARLWESGEYPVGEEPIPLAEKSVPPGEHVLAVRIEIRSREHARFGYVSEQSFSLSLPEGKRTRVEVTIEEDGDLPSYNPNIDIDIETDD